MIRLEVDRSSMAGELRITLANCQSQGLIIVEQWKGWHPPMVMKSYSHPALRNVPLHAVLQALSDPCRIAIVKELLGAKGRALACNEVRLSISKATRSHHFDVLREAGIIYTEVEGTKCMTSLRREELNRHFPGLLQLIARAERKVGGFTGVGSPGRGGETEGAA